uniref:Dynamin-type G domain-containing protein n=1 Tax=Hucho hucho TaxID=62062 RepID=A0A4W5R3X2_9TELE
EKEMMFQDQLAEKVRPFIDLIDDMRSIGIDKELPLPTIAVVGDQSSGKSSVLETLSGVALPRGTGIVTRCPLLLQLCNDRTVKWEAVISYGGKVVEFDEPSEVVRHVEHAQNVLAGKGVGICEDLITLKITSSTVCDLSLIDLPGITRVAVKGQPDDIGAHIKNLILKFIKNKRTIILVVVPCNVDIATTEALKMAQEMDPEGTRTLAILTKPDLIDPGAEKNVLEIVHNRVIFLNMGYVIVKCRGQKQIDENMSITHSNQTPNVYLFSLHQVHTGKHVVWYLLTCCLFAPGQKYLPHISEKIKEQLVEVKHLLSQIEDGPPLEPAEKRQYLIQVSTSFTFSSFSFANFLFLHQVVDEYDQKHRGTELPGFSNYRVFQHVVQKLEQQSNIVKARIGEQFEMEMLVYTQDEIFNKHLPKEEKAEGSDHNTRSKYPGLLKSYYEIVVQRLADQVPMLIHYFILKESAKIVCSEMLDLLHRDDTDIILQEDSEIGQYRAKLQAQADRLLLPAIILTTFDQQTEHFI